MRLIACSYVEVKRRQLASNRSRPHKGEPATTQRGAALAREQHLPLRFSGPLAMNRTRKELFLPTSGRILRGRRTLLSHGVELCLLVCHSTTHRRRQVSDALRGRAHLRACVTVSSASPAAQPRRSDRTHASKDSGSQRAARHRLPGERHARTIIRSSLSIARPCWSLLTCRQISMANIQDWSARSARTCRVFRGGRPSIIRVSLSSCQDSPRAVNRSFT